MLRRVIFSYFQMLTRVLIKNMLNIFSELKRNNQITIFPRVSVLERLPGGETLHIYLYLLIRYC